jgi:MFS superfamily sulfate permease-like transporter
MGALTIIAAIGFIILAQFTDFADTAFVLFAIIFSISGISDLIRGIKRWIK